MFGDKRKTVPVKVKGEFHKVGRRIRVLGALNEKEKQENDSRQTITLKRRTCCVIKSDAELGTDECIIRN